MFEIKSQIGFTNLEVIGCHTFRAEGPESMVYKVCEEQNQKAGCSNTSIAVSNVTIFSK